jgi:NAD(P)H-dependent FMN reductase
MSTMADPPRRLLALCGSLRHQSRSLALLEAFGHRAPAWSSFQIHRGLGLLPLFNPDDEARPSAEVRRLWAAVDQADALVIASPEYAHGVTGTIKNTLDWLVGHPPFAGKPVAVLNPSHRAEHADLALKETLRTMAARLVDGGCLRIPATSSELGAAQLARTPPYSTLIDDVWVALRTALADAPIGDEQAPAPPGPSHPQPQAVAENS